ncbi:MAG: hypothetical protein IT334_09710 [Thermomicrobiales bacterium]|nr:hypothetical protein [Thermomicrobiales bacterium]
MDFVVVGLGLGALMMLAGFGLRDLGPWLFGSNASDRTLPEFEAVKATIRKQTLASIGTAIATAGAGLAMVTSAALFAKTDDDIGTIVVGMSLALAAVGVGAWTYDTIRRYRAAMEMISSQEQAVITRLSPRPAPSKPTDVRKLTTRPEEQAPVAPIESPEASDETPEDDESAPAVNPEQPDFDMPEDPDELEQDEDLFEPELEDIKDWPIDPARNTNDASADEEPEPVVEEKADTEPEARITPIEPAPAPRWSPFTRSASPRPDPPAHADYSELPPLPEPGNDTLIEEAVRFDTRRPEDRNVPSWLFDDLETDLNSAGASKPEDPIDRFRGSAPRARGSALDRILAGDPPADASDDRDDEDEDPDRD